MVRSVYTISLYLHMKKLLFLLFFTSVLFGCSKPAPYKEYKLLTERDNLVSFGTLERGIEEDTIMARNDTLAYRRALTYFVAAVQTSQRFSGRMGTVYDFQLLDSAGMDIGMALGPAVTDTLVAKVKSIPGVDTLRFTNM
jgi:hypothetical protein